MEFERLKILVKDKFQDLENLCVLVLGVGGVGGYVVEGLARSGVKKIIIVDGDIVDVTNINRQIIALHSTIGKKKVEVLKERILDINPECEVIAYPIFFKEGCEYILDNKKIDYIVDCCDTIKSKELIIREAVKRDIKIISSMGAGFKFLPTKIMYAKLKNTDYDKLAKVLRHNLRDNKKCLEIPVVYSKEVIRHTDKEIGSNSFIPSIFGMYLVSFIIRDVIGGNYEI